eukprot:GHVU01074190.1.p1 GENE.GHVU01074190.1~~GHVU01074190.1.p1  ORF type:complete len:167 (+),score=24.54 GHVU01074190.1:78-503(+)
MAETACAGDEAQTPEDRADRMAEAAELMGHAARRAEQTGEVIKDYLFNRIECEYRGEVRKGEPHGIGVVRLPTAVYYDGEWRNGVLHGLGVQRLENGNIQYAGQWQDNVYHGLGVMRNKADRVAYAGWWNRNVRSETAPPE